ncbi:MAG: transcription elongation factor Spt5 [Candidatus Lokiarchaeota archaeon]|nr:transcription elongation factor Spt5 [Candidatus Lokiarchaeota archaeon]
MADKERVEEDEAETIDLDMTIKETDIDTTIFAVRTTLNQESNILKQIFYRFKILSPLPDIKGMLVTPLLPGFIFIEATQKTEVQRAIQGIQHIKGRIVGQIKLNEINHVLVPRSVTEYLEEGDKVEIISGVFTGRRAVIMRMPHDTSASEEVVVRLLQEESDITIKIHGDYLKLVEKAKRVEEPIPQIKAELEPTTDLEKTISFEDEYELEEIGITKVAEVTEKSEDWEEEEEEEDEWSKFEF